jgi:hypothetical protein
MFVLLSLVGAKLADPNSSVVRGLRLEGRARIDARSVMHWDP